MSDIDTNLNNTEEISATKNVRLKCPKNIDENHLLQSLQSGFIIKIKVVANYYIHSIFSSFFIFDKLEFFIL